MTPLDLESPEKKTSGRNSGTLPSKAAGTRTDAQPLRPAATSTKTEIEVDTVAMRLSAASVVPASVVAKALRGLRSPCAMDAK